MRLFNWMRQPRYAAIWRLLTWFLLIALGLRVALLARAALSGDAPAGWPAALALGTGYDVATAAYWLVVPVLLAVLPGVWGRRAGPVLRLLTITCYAVSAAVLAFDVAAEWLFWDEFGVRYNFIAVDYLVYTNEVVGNIRESYPLEWLIPLVILGGAGGVCVAAAGAAYRPWPRPHRTAGGRPRGCSGCPCCSRPG